MSILIKGMEMPKSCEDCKLRMAVGCYGILPHNTRMPNCPIVPIPPHGDLIDREFMRKRIDGSGYVEQIKGNLFYMLELAPTILEAEVGE